MYLLRAELHGVGPFDHLDLSFADEQDQPRRLVVIHGGGGVGKTSLLAAIGSSRPGHATAQQPRPDQVRAAEGVPSAWVAADWQLGQDDPERPHALRVASPNVKLPGPEDAELTRRREQALFDRVATEGGFAFLSIASTRWFSRQPIAIAAPSRGVARYDVKQPAGFDDATRSDLSRETKQALAYAEIGTALVERRPLESEVRLDTLGPAMLKVVSQLVRLTSFSYEGLDPVSWEPMFRSGEGTRMPFDALPTRVRHLTAFGALAVRTLWAAYPDRDPRISEGVVLIDEVDLHQDAAVALKLPAALRAALPSVQWILTTSSPVVASGASAGEVLALRSSAEGRVEIHAGPSATTH
ncbi:MAG: hypothetical protein EOO73_35215 [Myxococcales bacterium]|nr:MAG: hypothetical protein EOO73_35215 [Myxococcales bacterium]